MAEKILEVDKIDTYYGLSHILFGISLEVKKGEAVALLGRNGAGKTTTLKSIMGIVPPRSGSLKFRGDNILGLRPHVIARKGLGYVPEDRRIFPFLTLQENLEVAQKNIKGGWTIDKVFKLFPPLKMLQNSKGRHLSGGEQQMLTIARTLVGNPELILMDEPSEGLAPVVIDDLTEQMLQLKKEGITMLVSEQNLSLATAICDRAYIIENGQIRYQGSLDELQENEAVMKNYLAV